MKTPTLKLYNTLTKEIQTLNPINAGKVSMYHCGPTVYDYPHIGNLRSYVFADTLRRTCEFLGYTVDQVINITDVGHLVSDADTGEDKMEKSAIASGKTAHEIAEFFTDVFMKNLEDLNIKTEGTHFPRATAYIDEQIALIQKLEVSGHTYITSEGVYFDVSTFTEYGKLGNIDLKGLDVGHRVAESTEKKTPYDFALWKFSPKTGSTRQQEWPSPWGVGFPGWHIECSAMAQQILGETIDIHTGGIDHIPVHHNNEIAQSECITHKPLANIWMHGAFLNWKGGKMSKSDGSFVTLDNLTEKGISPLAFRYFLLQSKYRQEVMFDMESLEAAQTAYTRLLGRVKKMYLQSRTSDVLLAKTESELIEGSLIRLETLIENLTQYITDDLNTSQVLAYVWNMVKEGSSSDFLMQPDFKKFINKVDLLLGLNLIDACTENIDVEIPKHVQHLFEARTKAREEKNWAEADKLREEIKALGFQVID
jgi:cysteinyl-tRNA synthetase